jgi:hypothetical protein
MVRLVIFIGVVSSLLGQNISIMPQGEGAVKAIVGKKIKGYQILSVIACPADGKPLSIKGGAVYQQAMLEGYSPIAPAFAQAIISDGVAHNKKYYAIEGLKIGSMILLPLGTGKVVAMSASILTGLAIAHQVGDEVSAQLQARYPNAAALTGALLAPETSMDLSGSCKSAAILALYDRKAAKKAQSPPGITWTQMH